MSHPRRNLAVVRILMRRLRGWRERRAARARRRQWHSFSSVREYELCPRRYRYSYVDRVVEDRPAPDGWRYGTAVHRALEAAYRLRQRGVVDVAQLERTALFALQRAWHLERLPDDDWRARTEVLVRDTLRADVLRADRILGVELDLSARFDDDLAFAGRADLVLRRDDDTIEIVDHKITRNTRTPEDLKRDPQLNLYAWMARQRWPEATRVVASHHYPPAGSTVTVELDDATTRAAVERLAAVARQAAGDRRFRPHPGPHCKSCQWIVRCPAGAGALSDPG
jgi:RecB family exonuclease